MLNTRRPDELIEEARDAITSTLSEIPIVQEIDIEVDPPIDMVAIDFIVRFSAAGQDRAFVAEVVPNGQPKSVRQALYQLKYVRDTFAGEDDQALVLAPYLSPEARALCREMGAAYLDFHGNCRISFPEFYIEREVATRPKAAKRELKSLYKPKSLQVLRVLLRDPERAWKVASLAAAAEVSLGHVSNVRTALIERDFAKADELGLRLTRPAALLDEWRENHERPAGQRRGFYTPLHGQAFEEAVRSVMQRVGRDALLASFSAADWLAPYVRTPSQHLYVRREAFEQVRDQLQATTASKGENLFLTILHEDGVLRDAVEPADGVYATSYAQTYVDLYQAGDRGREAAEHLRREHMPWPM